MLGALEGDGFTHEATSHVHVSPTEATACFLEACVNVRLIDSNRKENKHNMLNVSYFVCDLLYSCVIDPHNTAPKSL